MTDKQTHATCREGQTNSLAEEQYGLEGNREKAT